MNQQHFQQNKLQILTCKKQYLQQYIKQIQNNIASTWEENQCLKQRIEDFSRPQKHQKQESNNLQKYKMIEREKIRKIEELTKLIQQYKYLCQQAVGQQSANNMQNSSLNRSISVKKVKTRIFCQQCQRYFFPQQYYRHCKEYHNEPGYMTLRS